MTMTTIGYGDIVPKNPIELAASLFIMVAYNLLKEKNSSSALPFSDLL